MTPHFLCARDRARPRAPRSGTPLITVAHGGSRAISIATQYPVHTMSAFLYHLAPFCHSLHVTVQCVLLFITLELL